MLAFPGRGVLGYWGDVYRTGHEARLRATALAAQAAAGAMGSGPACQKYQFLSLQLHSQPARGGSRGRAAAGPGWLGSHAGMPQPATALSPSLSQPPVEPQSPEEEEDREEEGLRAAGMQQPDPCSPKGWAVTPNRSSHKCRCGDRAPPLGSTETVGGRGGVEINKLT